MVDDDEELELLYIQSRRMKKLCATYPEVLIMDSTYQVNNRKLPLSSILVMDGNGEGRVVAHAILKNDRQETLRHFLVQFKEHNPCVQDSRVFLVDKDFNETVLLKEIWSEAQVFLCLFHVLKALKVRISQLPLPQSSKDTLRQLAQKVVYSHSEEQYSAALTALQLSAPAEFVQYFADNWDNCKEMWVEFSRMLALHLGNRTTNRVESFHGKLKHHVKQSSTVSRCVEELMRFDRGKNHEVDHRAFLDAVTVPYIHGNSSQVIDEIQRFATPYAASLMIKEVKKARETNATCRALSDGKEMEVKVRSASHVPLSLYNKISYLSILWFLLVMDRWLGRTLVNVWLNRPE